jgi:hypothetical protein
MPDGFLRGNPPGGASFGGGQRWLGPLASQALQVRCPATRCASRTAVSPLMGCAVLAAWATAKIRCRRIPSSFQTGS